MLKFSQCLGKKYTLATPLALDVYQMKSVCVLSITLSILQLLEKVWYLVYD